MDLNSTFGALLGLCVIFSAQWTLGVELNSWVQWLPVGVIGIGLLSSSLIAFDSSSLARAFSLTPYLLLDDASQNSHRSLCVLLLKWNELVRKEGVLSLDQEIQKEDNHYLKKWIQWLIEGHSFHTVQNLIQEKKKTLQKELEGGLAVFQHLILITPQLGVIAACFPLMQLGVSSSETSSLISRVESMGLMVNAILTAFILNVFLFIPMLKKISKRAQAELKELRIIEIGVLGILEGLHPKLIQEKLELELGVSFKPRKSDQPERTQVA